MFTPISGHHLIAQAKQFQETGKVLLTDICLNLADKYFGNFCFFLSHYWPLQFLWMKVWFEGTCSEKHNIILSVFSDYVIHHYLRQSVVHIDSLEGWCSCHWVHWLIHHRVPPYETDDIIRKVSGGFNQRIIGSAWTLKRNAYKNKRTAHTPQRCVPWATVNRWQSSGESHQCAINAVYLQ